MSAVLDKLREDWTQSDFTMTKEEILEGLDKAVDSIDMEEIRKRKNKDKSRKRKSPQ